MFKLLPIKTTQHESSSSTVFEHTGLTVDNVFIFIAESFQQEFLKTHNAYRAKHSAPALKLNAELNASAQSWANHLLATGTLQHSDTKDGENIFTVFSSASLKLTGHFTQVVWKDTTEVGVGMASSGNRAFVVGQYRKPGNMAMPGYFEKNVLPLV
ncbi:Golgi-associated plant pathogenesis-related protein 1-like isoform X2 [Channa argus]|uniref:Golgi-associated plant pathogenesis-related protein 1-like isoform X2 n=1 Tax=Channa argus TaxID=215402 RepID=UPI0035213E67